MKKGTTKKGTAKKGTAKKGTAKKSLAEPPQSIPTRRFEYIEGTARKFWEIDLGGTGYIVTFGRIGTDGQEQLKSFASEQLALAAYRKIVAEKLAKGYREVGDSVVVPDAPVGSDAAVAAPTEVAAGEPMLRDHGLDATAVAFSRDTSAYLIAGRVVEIHAGTTAALRKLAATCTTWSKKLDATLLAVPGGSVRKDEEDYLASLVIGACIAGADADTCPSGPLDVMELRRAVAEATARIPAGFWDDVGKLLGENASKLGKLGLHVVATGPLAAGYLAYSVEVELPDWEALQDGAEEPRPPRGSRLVAGQDMRQQRHDRGIIGVQVVEVGYEMGGTKSVRLGAADHDKRDAAAAKVDGDAGDYLIARYD